MKPGDDLYLKAREILRGNPELGKKRLAMMLGVKTPTSRRLQERYRGEVQGHNSGHPVYERVRKAPPQPNSNGRRHGQVRTGLSRFRDVQQHSVSQGVGPGITEKRSTPETVAAHSNISLPSLVTRLSSASRSRRISRANCRTR